MQIFKVIIGIAAALLIAMVVTFMIDASGPSDPVERLKAGCQREFGYRGEIAVNECVLRNMILESREIHERKLDAARR